MNGLVQLLAAIEGIILIGVGALEAFQFHNQRLYPIFRIRPADAAAVRLWVVNQGFYNIVWGVGLLIGLLLVNVGNVTVGATMVLFTCVAHIVLGIVLGISEPKLARSALAQAGLPFLVVLFAVLTM